MKTKSTDELPEITWEKGYLISLDQDERMEVYEVDGVDDFGNKYTGTAYFTCDLLDEVVEIEKL